MKEELKGEGGRVGEPSREKGQRPGGWGGVGARVCLRNGKEAGGNSGGGSMMLNVDRR